MRAVRSQAAPDLRPALLGLAFLGLCWPLSRVRRRRTQLCWAGRSVEIRVTPATRMLYQGHAVDVLLDGQPLAPADGLLSGDSRVGSFLGSDGREHVIESRVSQRLFDLRPGQCHAGNAHCAPRTDDTEGPGQREPTDATTPQLHRVRWILLRQAHPFIFCKRRPASQRSSSPTRPARAARRPAATQTSQAASARSTTAAVPGCQARPAPLNTRHSNSDQPT